MLLSAMFAILVDRQNHQRHFKAIYVSQWWLLLNLVKFSPVVLEEKDYSCQVMRKAKFLLPLPTSKIKLISSPLVQIYVFLFYWCRWQRTGEIFMYAFLACFGFSIWTWQPITFFTSVLMKEKIVSFSLMLIGANCLSIIRY